ncbi:enhancer of polycomb-like-domain-containing protein [Geopyxis carbonaria]|nr:enhancer of polycomb-like-domain-containing protein [Geopyxis carbonaria]
MTRSTANNRFRTRKLSTKQTLAVLRENQIDSVDDDAQRNIPQIETGVERQEETEHHLQAVISAGHAGTKDILIPTPNTSEIPLAEFQKLYPTKFTQPTSYIRFSSTVEDCNGTAYCMSSADDEYLSKLNSTVRKPLEPISEDDFEAVMDLYESTIQLRQPFLSVDVTSVMSYEEMESSFEEGLEPSLKNIAKLLYSHWKEQKIARGGRALIPVLKKFEQGNEKDDGDPYVCFRRREVRQVRKTRRTDAQSSDKLKRIRQELETARGLVKDVLQRETMRKNQFEYERQIFEKRRTMVDLKRKLNIRGDDEDLINKPKRRPTEQTTAPAIRMPLRQEGKQAEVDLRQLHHVLAEEEKRRLERFQLLKRSRPVPKYPIADITDSLLSRTSLKPISIPTSNFCGVQAFYLPSPPPSVESMDSSPKMEDTQLNTHPHVSIVQASPQKDIVYSLPTCRRRRGRGGRVMLDRRHPPGVISRHTDSLIVDRNKYDRNNDDFDAECPIYRFDPHSQEQIVFRSRMLSPPPEPPAAQPVYAQRRAIFGSPAIGQSNTMMSNPSPQTPAASSHPPQPPQNYQAATPNPPIPTVMINGQNMPYNR